ncbi:serine/threonine protein kinase [Candidatus Micrarchaeota archaeon]|nr:serine/threonine protein kinase [Candidatus Micrarchaeota archaeon]
MEQRRARGQAKAAQEIKKEPLYDDSPKNLIGRTIDGKYSIISEIGRGGMGRVYKAKTKEGRTVALKVIDGAISDQATVRRFIREVKAMKETNHPNTVNVYDLGAIGEDLYCVMQYLKGNDLAAELRKNATIRKNLETGQEEVVRNPLPWTEVKQIMIQICDAVNSAHKRGILHRDLKPGNIFLHEKDGRRIVKVVDFGLAKFTSGEGDETLTKTGTVMGTFKYMAPELSRGMNSGDARTDQYAIGIIMYELLTGDVPFKDDDFLKVMDLHRNQIPKEPRRINPDIPRKVERIILKAIEKLQKNRFPSLEEMKIAIENDGEESDMKDHIERNSIEAPEKIRSDVTLTEFIEDDIEIEGKHAGRIPGIVAVIASLAVIGTAIAFQDRITDFIDSLISRPVPVKAENKNETVPEIKTTFQATIETVPQGAVIYDEAQKKVGTADTPLVLELERKEHTFIVKMGGRIPKTVVVSPYSPKTKVYLPKRRARPAVPVETADPAEAE